MTIIRLTYLHALAFACGFLTASCGEDVTCESTGSGGSATGGAGVTGGASGSSGSGGVGGTASGGSSGADADATPPCDETKTPDTEGCLVADQYAVFVAASATDGDGTQDAPFGTIAEGVAAAKSRNVARVIVCNATYAEKVTLTSAQAGINMFGGYKCPGDADAWARTVDEKPLVAPTTGTALQIDGVAGVTIQDVDFKSADALATAPGSSSIAAIVTASTDVVLRRVAITAGRRWGSGSEWNGSRSRARTRSGADGYSG